MNHKKFLSSIKTTLRQLKIHQTELNQLLSHNDRELSDLQHYLELKTFSASAGYKLAKKMKDVCETRRDVKNQLSFVSKTINSFEDILKADQDANALKKFTVRTKVLEDTLGVTVKRI